MIEGCCQMAFGVQYWTGVGGRILYVDRKKYFGYVSVFYDCLLKEILWLFIESSLKVVYRAPYATLMVDFELFIVDC